MRACVHACGPTTAVMPSAPYPAHTLCTAACFLAFLDVMFCYVFTSFLLVCVVFALSSSTTKKRIIGYPPLPSDHPSQAMSCGEHTDYGTYYNKQKTTTTINKHTRKQQIRFLLFGRVCLCICVRVSFLFVVVLVWGNAKWDRSLLRSFTS